LRVTHYITLAIAIALIALLYWGGNTVPPAKKLVANMQPTAGAMTQGPNTMKPASFDSIVSASRRQLPKTVADSVLTIENELTAMRDSSGMASVFMRLSGVWKRNNIATVAAYYMGKEAKLENSEKKLTFAGQNFLQLMENEGSPSVQLWEAKEAVSCLEQSLKIDPDNEETKLGLATGYIEGTGEPMRGVQILLAITRDKPDDIPANMLLGRMSIQSAQFDKAVGRFETILKQEPENKEALYFQAQAYEGKGDKKKAIEILEKCKKVVNNPDFSKDIDQHINSLK
jgi:thioredoxin-like negative regulator of GroEL